MTVQIADWKLLQLTVEDIGPFRSGPQTFSFAGEPTDEEPDPGPSNLYMLLAKNGHGKTTLLECIHGLFGLMAEPPVGRFVSPGETGKAQLDVRATWTVEGKTQTVVLSLWVGLASPLIAWGAKDLNAAQASTWARLRLANSYNGPAPVDGTDDLGLILYRAVLEARHRAPDALFGEGEDMPSVLFFPADRRIHRPEDTRRVERPRDFTYQPAQCFSSDGPDWDTTIDNVLVWLDWINDGRLEDLLKFVNTQMFDDEAEKAIRAPRRQDLASYVSTRTGEHSLIGLSHGERTLLQLYVRVACSMTSNTVILIDEVETHLHARWMFRLFDALKALLRRTPSLSVVFTTHNRELIRVFNHGVKEEGLVKGGFLIEDGMI